MSSPDLTRHYVRGDLLARLEAALREDGADPSRPTLEQLSPYDQFHGRGLEATEEVGGLLPARAADHLLDVGSGIGGPARWYARRFDCRVTGIDLTPEFCAIASELARRTGLAGRVGFERGDALAMPFAGAAFDGAYSMNVSMNIADKAALYREIRRVLKPGGWLALSEIARGDNAAPLDYPVPWAGDERSSFLATREQTRRGLESAGFEVLRLESVLEASLAFGERSRAAVARGEKPPHRAVILVHGELAGPMMANSSRALADRRIEPIEILARLR